MATGLQLNLNRVIGRTSPDTYLDAQGAANVWAGTTGLDLLGALNAKAGTTGIGLNLVCNIIAGTSNLDADGASEYFGAFGIPILNSISAWYDGAAVNGIGVSNPVDAAVITTWKDISGNGRDVTQGTNSLRPVFAQSAAAVNSQPSVWFNNNTDSMSSTVAAPLVANKSIYTVVHRISSGINSPQSIYMQRNPSVSSYGPQVRLTGPGASSATTVDYRVATNPDLLTATTVATVANGTTNVLSMISNGSGSVVTSIKGFINGTLSSAVTGSGNLTDASNLITLGAGTGVIAHNCVYGYFATILTYDTTHTDAERQLIERWLGSRYNVTVA